VYKGTNKRESSYSP